MRKLITGLLLVVIVLFFAEVGISSDEEPIIGWDGKPVPGRVTKSKPGENLSLPGAMGKSTGVLANEVRADEAKRPELAIKLFKEIMESGAIDELQDGGWVIYVQWNQAVWPLTHSKKNTIGHCFGDIYKGKQIEIRDAHSGKRMLTVIKSGYVHVY